MHRYLGRYKVKIRPGTTSNAQSANVSDQLFNKNNVNDKVMHSSHQAKPIQMAEIDKLMELDPIDPIN